MEKVKLRSYEIEGYGAKLREADRAKIVDVLGDCLLMIDNVPPKFLLQSGAARGMALQIEDAIPKDWESSPPNSNSVLSREHWRHRAACLLSASYTTQRETRHVVIRELVYSLQILHIEIGPTEEARLVRKESYESGLEMYSPDYDYEE